MRTRNNLTSKRNSWKRKGEEEEEEEENSIPCCSSIQIRWRFQHFPVKKPPPKQTPFTLKVTISSWSRSDKDLDYPSESGSAPTLHSPFWTRAADQHQEAWPRFPEVGRGHSPHLCPTWAIRAPQEMMSTWLNPNTFTVTHKYSKSHFVFCCVDQVVRQQNNRLDEDEKSNQLGSLCVSGANSQHAARALFYGTRESFYFLSPKLIQCRSL